MLWIQSEKKLELVLKAKRKIVLANIVFCKQHNSVVCLDLILFTSLIPYVDAEFIYGRGLTFEEAWLFLTLIIILARQSLSHGIHSSTCPEINIYCFILEPHNRNFFDLHTCLCILFSFRAVGNDMNRRVYWLEYDNINYIILKQLNIKQSKCKRMTFI